MKQYKSLYIPVSIILGAVIISFTILYAMGGGSIGTLTAGIPTNIQPSSAQGGSGSANELEITESDHIRGNINAPITLIEFSDMQCPFCQRFHPTVQQALDEYGDDIRWVYKHFPLDSIHPQARPAAEASECVWEQKGNTGFWEFVDAMFENQSRLGAAYYEEVAQQIGVNLSQFQTCVSERKYQDKVQADLDAGVKVGVTGTPGSFVNDVVVKGAIPYEQLKSIIDFELSR